jgi:SAM-dependent methyltransferase
VSLFVPEERNVLEYKAFLEARLPALGVEAEIMLEGLCEDDWAESWKQYYKPVKIGRVTVVPAWEEYTASEGETVIRMDPGMAFGTGTHETTRLVIRLLDKVMKGGERVLDVGTGSGILSICASKLGALSCNAYDIDPTAVKVAKENVLRDGCKNITVGVSDLLAGVDLAGGKYDLCVAIGPMIMMKFCCLTTKKYDLKTIVSMNPIMVDGTGMCGACRLVVGDEVKFACVDGPEFDGHLVVFDQAMKRQQMYKTQEGRAMLKLQEGDTHHGGCGNCGGDE